MNDSILNRYREQATQEEKARIAKRRQQAAINEQERLHLLDTIPDALDRMFARLEETNYADEMVKGMIRLIQLETSEVVEAVTWMVGRSEPWQWTSEDKISDSLFISSGRIFGRSVGAYPAQSKPLTQFELDTLKLSELQRVVSGIELVGMRRSDWKAKS